MKDDKFAGEIMSDEELDEVSGGCMYQTAMDSQFLHGLTGSCGAYNPDDVVGGKHNAEIAAAWKNVGIFALISSGHKVGNGTAGTCTYAGVTNLYFIMTDDKKNLLKPVNQFEAMQYAVEYVKSHS